MNFIDMILLMSVCQLVLWINTDMLSIDFRNEYDLYHQCYGWIDGMD